MVSYLTKATEPAPLIRVRVPFPKSLRENGKITDAYREVIARACGDKKLSVEQDYSVSMNFYGKWKDTNNKRRRRDHLNYVCHLIDLLCAAWGIDDSAIVHWGDLWKIHKPDGPEYVEVTVRLSKMR